MASWGPDGVGSPWIPGHNTLWASSEPAFPLLLLLYMSSAPSTQGSVTVCPGVPPAPTSPLSLQMSQGNPSLGNLLNIKTEVEGSPTVEPSPFLGKAVKALVQERLAEPWKMYLRRCGLAREGVRGGGAGRSGSRPP